MYNTTLQKPKYVIYPKIGMIQLFTLGVSYVGM